MGLPADDLSRVFAALADPTRRDMVARLTNADATVGELAAPYEVTVQAVSKHLRVLEDAGLISRTRRAQQRPAHLEADVLDLMTKWIERYRRQAEQRYVRLDTVLAEIEPTPPRRVGMTAATPHDTEIVVDDTVPTIRATREFDHPVANVFRAHTDSRLFARWIGPHGFTTAIDDWDCRTGGNWSYTQIDTGGERYGFYGSFHEIRPDALIVQTFTFAELPDVVVLDRVTFTELDGGRTRVTTLSLTDSFENRDTMIASGMETGVREGYAKLDELLAG